MRIAEIAKIRNQKRQERKSKSLKSSRSVDLLSSESSRTNAEDTAKSKRIGKVVIKLRNGKKLVVKKRRKLNNEFIKPTTQKPVLVTVKSRGSNFKQKSKISSRPNNISPRPDTVKPFVPVSARPTHVFNSAEGKTSS